VSNIGDYAFEDCTSLTSITVPGSVTSIGQFAFYQCFGLTSVTIGNSVLGPFEFEGCTNLSKVYFQGNTPEGGSCAFCSDKIAIAYYLAGTTGWAAFAAFSGIQTSVWTLPYPLVLSGSLGIRTNGFGFTVSWATNASVVVEAATELDNPVWSPVATNALS